MPSYAQAITTQYADIFFDGDVTAAEMYTGYGRTAFLQWGGAVNRPAVVRKHKTKPLWIIAAAIMRNSNDKDNALPQATSLFNLPTANVSGLRLTIRAQGSVYLYDETLAVPRLTQLDTWHEATHPSYWSKDVSLEAELAQGHRTMVALFHTETPRGALPGDYRQFRTFARLQVPGDAVTHTVTLPRATHEGAAVGICLLGRPSMGGTAGCLRISIRSPDRSPQQHGLLPSADAILPNPGWQWVRVDVGLMSDSIPPANSKHLVELTAITGEGFSGVDLDKIVILGSGAGCPEVSSLAGDWS